MAKISKKYRPTQKEKFMNAKMKEYFRQKLENWKSELLKESSQTLNNLQTENEAKPDIIVASMLLLKIPTIVAIIAAKILGLLSNCIVPALSKKIAGNIIAGKIAEGT